ncbi:unnamed protein product [Ilex paraguariensis]|uniref:Uncharacterized protein n=1 Tax=Ilex paraguariensis TaxID=185542 RepID=A0ABC8QL71_9AQUA
MAARGMGWRGEMGRPVRSGSLGEVIHGGCSQMEELCGGLAGRIAVCGEVCWGEGWIHNIPRALHKLTLVIAYSTVIRVSPALCYFPQIGKQELRRLIRKRIYILATLNATTSLLSTGMLDREKQAKKQQDTEYEGAGGRANDQLKS